MIHNKRAQQSKYKYIYITAASLFQLPLTSDSLDEDGGASVVLTMQLMRQRETDSFRCVLFRLMADEVEETLRREGRIAGHEGLDGPATFSKGLNNYTMACFRKAVVEHTFIKRDLH
jgi:hypothetical protein